MVSTLTPGCDLGSGQADGQSPCSSIVLGSGGSQDVHLNRTRANRELGVYDGAMSVAKMLKVKFPTKLPSGRVPCLYYHVHGSCARSPCQYDNDHIKHSAADTAALLTHVAEHRAMVKA
jgi:hypothetical protein